jgi:NADH dehydrogenase/NADH:ubiquinone oxidoreductase subunit G
MIYFIVGFIIAILVAQTIKIDVISRETTENDGAWINLLKRTSKLEDVVAVLERTEKINAINKKIEELEKKYRVKVSLVDGYDNYRFCGNYVTVKIEDKNFYEVNKIEFLSKEILGGEFEQKIKIYLFDKKFA